MPQGKYFRIGYGIIIVLLIVFLASKVDFLFRPIGVVVQTLLLPFILSGVLYYIMRPLVTLLERRGVKRAYGVPIIFLLFLGLVVMLVLLVGPVIQEQINSLLTNAPQMISLVQKQVDKLQENRWIADYYNEHQQEIEAKIAEFSKNILSSTGNALNTLLGFISDVVVLLSTVPFIVYYLLKEGDKFSKFVLRVTPDEHDDEAMKILKDMDAALSNYIQGKFLVSLGLGILMYVGYEIIGLQYSLILALVLTMMNLIPFVGVFIGMIPSVVVALIDSPAMVIKVIVVVVIAQQIENNFISPQVMGKKLAIHPLTIILLLIAVGSLTGLLGMFVAIPTYAVIKVVASHLYRLYRIRRHKRPPGDTGAPT
ncbi:MAG: AI-2E family transporter [Paenibacillaceae bacterium]|nr:AI-2E family transporter [Paenibacillaceae bacterium]